MLLLVVKVLATSNGFSTGPGRPAKVGRLATLTALRRGRASPHASGDISVTSPSNEGRASDVNMMDKCLNRGKCSIAAATAS